MPGTGAAVDLDFSAPWPKAQESASPVGPGRRWLFWACVGRCRLFFFFLKSWRNSKSRGKGGVYVLHQEVERAPMILNFGVEV